SDHPRESLAEPVSQLSLWGFLSALRLLRGYPLRLDGRSRARVGECPDRRIRADVSARIRRRLWRLVLDGAYGWAGPVVVACAGPRVHHLLLLSDAHLRARGLAGDRRGSTNPTDAPAGAR